MCRTLAIWRRHQCRRKCALTTILVVLVVFGQLVLTDALDVIQLFGPKIHPKPTTAVRRSLDAAHDHNEQVRAIAAKFGYPFEAHEVITEDGYILTLHRLPYTNRTQNPRRQREAVLIMPGFFGSSESFMFRGPDKDLCYSLLEAGYDVWMANPRGSHHSRRHQIYDPNTDAEYWNFSYHEIGYYDLAASIDYILQLTSHQRLFLIGYSMGATASWVLLSQRPQYNGRVKYLASLAGIGVVAHRLQPHLKLIVNSIPVLTSLCKRSNVFELFPRREMIAEVLKTICRDGSPLQSLCLKVIYAVAGHGVQQFNTVNIPFIFTYFPSGSSMNTMLHYYQTYTSGHFAKMQAYNATGNDTWNDYDLSKITVPISLHYGPSDILNTKQDNVATASKLKNVVGIFRVPFPEFNHMDFMWGKDAKKLLYDQLIILMDKYR